ncbi:6c5789e0-2989-41d9-8f76-9cb32dfbb882 [Sclerotinia trifoliorum]|uniref:6c5789e0-2989-41d9-8f76-9cb32dfbb882 n=1 Tax=Sclerotinia trifoliorum TaxID=28548 RepID=A0A8H2ZME1_9HELO|nr:6c5789e0-2989-41d9-8f76-9cb32dfbb882 [Sclerotinia trifoliorum]
MLTTHTTTPTMNHLTFSPHKLESHLITYLALNLLLTILNKRVLAQYPYPWLLTAWHALCSSMGTYLSRRLDPINSKPEHLSRSRGKNHYIFMFSILYTVNIAVSNVSLGIMSISDHLILRSTIPIIVLALTQLLHLPHKPYTRLTLLTLIPLTTGILVTTQNTQSLTPSTIPLPLLSTLLSSTTTLTLSLLQTQLPLSPLHLLHSLAPLTGIQSTLWSYMNGEIDEFLIKQISSHNSSLTSSPTGMFLLLINGIVAFLLNFSSFSTNRKTCALTMAVLGNMGLVLAMVISGVALSAAEPVLYRYMDIFGVLLVLGGGFLYILCEVKA